jgi:3-hydroxyisobutyrate dehydrogenase-like beta-hydroxyacid dehydrogenase
LRSTTVCPVCSAAISNRAAPSTFPTKTRNLRPNSPKSLEVPPLLANVSQKVYQMARAAGLAKEDGAAIVKLYERMAGVDLGPG